MWPDSGLSPVMAGEYSTSWRIAVEALRDKARLQILAYATMRKASG